MARSTAEALKAATSDRAESWPDVDWRTQPHQALLTDIVRAQEGRQIRTAEGRAALNHARQQLRRPIPLDQADKAEKSCHFRLLEIYWAVVRECRGNVMPPPPLGDIWFQRADVQALWERLETMLDADTGDDAEYPPR